MNDKGKITSDEAKMAEILSEQYRNMFSSPSENIADMDCDYLHADHWNKMDSVFVNSELISEALK